jgi:hypothetical protein
MPLEAVGLEVHPHLVVEDLLKLRLEEVEGHLLVVEVEEDHLVGHQGLAIRHLGLHLESRLVEVVLDQHPVVLALEFHPGHPRHVEH